MYSFAQNAGIKRKITDKQSEIALIGATVSVIGFNSFSTIKDDNGNFQINNVRLSIQTISVSYIVYMPSYLMYFQRVALKDIAKQNPAHKKTPQLLEEFNLLI